MAYLGEGKYQENYRYGELRSEPEFFDLHVTRLVSGLSRICQEVEGKVYRKQRVPETDE